MIQDLDSDKQVAVYDPIHRCELDCLLELPLLVLCDVWVEPPDENNHPTGENDDSAGPDQIPLIWPQQCARSDYPDPVRVALYLKVLS